MVDDRPPPPDWDARFSRDDYLFGTAPNEFLVTCRDLIPPGGRVLCVADGEGRNGTWLAQQGFAVDAFDGSPVGVAKAERLAAERGVSVAYEVARVGDWRWPEAAYDAIVSIFIQFSPPAERRQVFAGILRALRPGGLLLLEGYALGQLAHRSGGPRIPDQLYTEEQLRAELGAFTIETLREYEAHIDEGPAHSGLSAVIDVVARRPPSLVTAPGR
jgi:SAM-dependent methyltransferase